MYRERRIRSLMTLFGVYAAALAIVFAVSDGPDLGCILLGIAGHVVYASIKLGVSFRDALWLERA